VRGEGSYVWDADGRRYLDMYGGHCVALAGHGHPRLVAAIREQAGRLLFYSNVVYSDVRALAAERVASLAPEGLRRVFFCNSGTEGQRDGAQAGAQVDRPQARDLDARGLPRAHARQPGRDRGWASTATRPTRCRSEHAFVPYGDLPALQAAFEAAPRGADGQQRRGGR
jgi:acetylornithine/succinyldiaminopimelate/putrescine aminotransferase